MDRVEIGPAKHFKGEFLPPSDKSISHRAVILASLARGKSSVRNVLRAQDTGSTMNAFRSLGVEIIDEGGSLTIYGKGLHGLSEPQDVIDCGNSGTTIRLISGVLSGNPFFSVLTGDDSLRRRPMARILRPLGLMGSQIMARDDNRYPPLAIQGGDLKPIRYEMPVASAQVKSSLLLAGLYSEGETQIVEPTKSRDHTERMLPSQGADIRVDGLSVFIRGGRELSPIEMEVPGDFSSAAFFIVAALLLPDSEIVVRDVGINPTRTGLLDALSKMGARVVIENVREMSGEPVADIRCIGRAGLKAVDLAGEIIPSLIDEFPVLCIAAAHAEGFTTIRGAEELRVKESDRINAMASGLKKMGAAVEEYPDGIGIQGRERLKGAEVESHGDHRIAMALAIAALAAEGRTIIQGASAVDISFPAFFEILGRLST